MIAFPEALDRERGAFRPYILVLTTSPLHPERIIATDYERLRHISIPRTVLAKVLVGQIDWLRCEIVEHYVKASGVVAPYGEIAGYVFRRSPDDSILFGTDGLPINYFARTPIEAKLVTG
jgi:hypothetical protein